MNIFELLIVQPIFNLLIGLYAIVPGGDFGISIILFTIIVRFALYPLTRSMLHQTRAMRKLQPQLAKIKKKSGGDKQVERMQMLELYKRNNVNPFRSIGILLIQLPIFIALFQVIQIFTSRREEIAKFTYDFLEKIEPIQAVIANPADFNEKLFNTVELARPAFTSNGVELALIFLALIAAATQYIMSKQTMAQQEPTRGLRAVMAEAAEGKQADQAEMNAIVMSKMTKVLPVVMFFIMISVPGALALYYAVSNIVAVLQQRHLLKQDEDELEEIADEIIEKPKHKKATAKAQQKQSAAATKPSSDTVVRIKAKDSKRK